MSTIFQTIVLACSSRFLDYLLQSELEGGVIAQGRDQLTGAERDGAQVRPRHHGDPTSSVRTIITYDLIDNKQRRRQ
jgi:hypothetical protein